MSNTVMMKVGTPDAGTQSFSAAQLQGMAQALNDVGVAVGQVRLDAIHAGRALGDPEIVQLLGQNLSLLNLSSSFAVQAARVTLADAAGAVNQVGGATAAARTALAQLKALDKAIRIGAGVIVLGSAVFTGDPQQIAQAAGGVFTAISS